MTPWTVAYQAPLSVLCFKQEYWSGLPFPSPGDLPDPGIKLGSPALEAGAFNLWATREAKNTLEGNNNRLTEAEEWHNELEDRMVEIVTDEQSKGKRMKINEESFRDLWDSIKHNIWAIEVPEEEEKRKPLSNFLKIL